MTNRRTSYVARINGVLDHIDRHLGEPLDLASLAAIAHVSPWHFHRLFQAFTGETLADRVRRRRVEIAAVRLLATPSATALSIAIDVGFGSAEVFTRAFKAHFGVTPSAWRRGAFKAWTEQRRIELSKIHQGSRKPHQAVADALRDDERTRTDEVRASTNQGAEMNDTIEFRTFPQARVAYLRHHGPYGDPGIGRLWQRLEAWSRERRLFEQGRAAYGLSQDDPDITTANRCRYDACIEIDEAFRGESDVGVQTLPGGLYACRQYTGTGEAIHVAWMDFFKRWLPDSPYRIDDRPCVEFYGSDPSVDPKTGVFSCQLCMPVRSA